MKKFLLLLSFLLFYYSSDAQVYEKDRWIWDEGNERVYNMKANLEWKLPDVDWRVADENTFPPGMKFCAAVEGDVICASIYSMPFNKAIYDDYVWKHEQEFIDGFSSSIGVQNLDLQGMKCGRVKSEKCYFLSKKALFFNMSAEISDDRLGKNSPMKMMYSGYAFEKYGVAYLVMVLVPVKYLEEYGKEFLNFFFSTFRYID